MALPVVIALAGCTGPTVPEAPARGEFSSETVDLKGRPGPPPGPAGACWQADIRPAVIETVTEQILLSPEERDAEGNLVSAAVFTTETRQQMVEERGTIWFRSPCPTEMTPEFIATLQRAMKARGLYLLPLTGVLDVATREAIGRYQRARGLDSDHLSLAAARDLGIIAADHGR